ncbi:hypothetical protein TTY48_12010 [Tsukamurella sp. TY48]|uniref:hypothetical protein n=1 Tax=Tsukamurella sp. TY48 TaxID=2775495 RepID=UPI001C7DC004|nr:hypothetical protein [Tsukamurella sp. TY48]GIZ96589.1 hypothetical protein TTY48_12010 [Tsukamurella sp. TY48]
MSDEQSISVAELLARNGGSAAPAGGRRRRHRGGENSITVAELTGEIPVVRDGAPSAEAPSAEAPSAEVPSAPAAAAPAAAAPSAPVEQPAPQAPEPQAPAAEPVQAQPQWQAPRAPLAPAASGEATDTFEAVHDEPEEEPASSASLAQAVADTGRFEAIDPGNVDEYPIAAPSEPAPAAPAAPVEEVQDEVVETVHTTEGHAEVNHAWSQWSDGTAPGMATADFNTAQVRERQARLQAEAAEAPAVETPEVPTVAQAAAVPVPDTASLSVQQIGDAKDDTPDFLADEPAQDVAEKDGADVDDDAPRTGRSWALLIAEVLGGVIAGAALFYGFYQLWNWGGGTWTIGLTVVLAFVVIIAIVTFTHYLRKTTDYVTLGLSLFVGLVITFGPLLMSLSQS